MPVRAAGQRTFPRSPATPTQRLRSPIVAFLVARAGKAGSFLGPFSRGMAILLVPSHRHRRLSRQVTVDVKGASVPLIFCLGHAVAGPEHAATKRLCVFFCLFACPRPLYKIFALLTFALPSHRSFSLLPCCEEPLARTQDARWPANERAMCLSLHFFRWRASKRPKGP